jgi:sarcosine oxidase subunit gamma
MNRQSETASVTELPPAARYSLRVAKENRSAAAAAFGCELPRQIGAVAAKKSRQALCLGPDEWQLDAGESEAPAIRAAFASIYADAPHSLVDISDRETIFQVKGARAEDLLSVACPRDLQKMAPGSGTRTVFDTVQAVLIRETEERYTLTVWRKFAPHVAELLTIANAELAAGL